MYTRSLAVLILALVPSAASAQAAAASPDAAPQVHFSGYAQLDYRAPLEKASETPDSFRFRRVRLQGTGTLNPKIGWAVSIEATTSPVLRDAFVTLKYFPAATLRIGQLVMPYGREQYIFSSNTLEFTERVTSEVIAFRDAGIVVSNDRPFFGWLSYAGGVTNGTRQNTPDNNSAKDGIVRVMAAPPRFAGLQVGVSAMKGDQPEGMRTRTGADVTLERRLFHVAAEFDREQTGDLPLKRVGYVFGAWRFYPHSVHPGFDHMEFGTRLARSSNLATPVNQWDLSANYYVHPSMRFMFDWIVPTNRSSGDSPATFQARANVRF